MGVRKEKYICIYKKKEKERERQRAKKMATRVTEEKKGKRRVLFSDDRETSATFFAHNVITRYCIAVGERLSFYLTPVSLLNPTVRTNRPASRRPRRHFLPPRSLSVRAARSNVSSFTDVARSARRGDGETVRKERMRSGRRRRGRGRRKSAVNRARDFLLTGLLAVLCANIPI